MLQRTFTLLIILVLILSSVYAQEFYSPTIGKMTALVTIRGSGSISDLHPGEEARLQILDLQDSDQQVVVPVREELIINGKTITATHVLDESDNKYALFTIRENGSFTYELTARVIRSAFIAQLTDYSITTSPDITAPFLEPSPKVESNSDEIINLAALKLPTSNFLSSLEDAIEWTNTYVNYAYGSDFEYYYQSQKSAVETLNSKKGVCDEFANLAASLLRAKKIPTRMTLGITFDGEKWGNHAWVEVYHKDLGWIPSDPTFRETGFVDATHIRRGSFTDVSDVVALTGKTVLPSTAHFQWQQQETPDINILSKEYFNLVSLSAKGLTLNEKQWNEIVVTVTNLTDSPLIAPVSIPATYKEIYFADKRAGKPVMSKTVTLAPHEKKTVSFFVYPNTSLAAGEYAIGPLAIYSLAAPLEQQIRIEHKADSSRPSQGIDGNVSVLDITPIIASDSFTLNIETANNHATQTEMHATLSDANGTISWDDTIPPFTTQTTNKLLGGHPHGTYVLTITTPTTTYTQEFTLQEYASSTPLSPEQTTTIIDQKVTPSTPEINIPALFEQPEVILIGVLLVIAVILLGLFAVRKRYV